MENGLAIKRRKLHIRDMQQALMEIDPAFYSQVIEDGTIIEENTDSSFPVLAEATIASSRGYITVDSELVEALNIDPTGGSTDGVFL